MTGDMAKAKSIFLRAIEELEPVQWSEFLDIECADDVAMRTQVEKLLQAHSSLGTYHAKVVEDIAPTIDTAFIAEKPGMKIDRYKLVHEIGHGGMGVVYMAVQKEPVRRKVALKIIKPGMDTREVVRRFEGERQALALMNHPSIAKVLDGGSTESGRPYFVMELVEGTPITEYCDAARYSTRQRLELFGQVCQAVQHAHLKGIIHRDLKPSNILATNYDHIAMTKVIDFGIARAVHQPLTDQSVYTHVSQIVGTPLYMSPEQVERSGLDIDTRTDVYSLGVLLYELLTGSTPFDKERLQNSSLDEMKRIIREENPPKPSTRLSTLDAALDTVADKHHTDLRTLTQELSGELDWIVMKALEKDRARRYESTSDFAKDIQRYLDDEPVEACPPSTTYRLRKFARRHKAKFVAMATIAAVLLMATVVSSSLAAWALHAEGEAADRLAGEKAARQEAQDQAEEAESARQQESQARAAALHERDIAEDHLYRADMRLGLVDAEAGTVHRLFRQLERHVASQNGHDRRGWEWHYLLGQCQQAQRTLYGHSRRVSDVSWSPDGQHVGSVSYDGTAKVWDTELWRPVRTILRGKTIKCCGAWDPHGRRFAWGSAAPDNTVCIWNTETDEVQTLRGNTFSVWGLAWCPDGKRLAASSMEDTVVWDAESGELIRRIEGRFGWLAWHPDGSFLASAGWGGLRVLNPTNGQVVWDKPATGADRLEAVAWRPDGKQLAIGGSGKFSQLTFVDTDKWQMESRSTNIPGSISSIAYSPDGRLLATGRSDNLVRVWDVSSRELIRTFCGHRDRVTSVSWSPNGRRLVSGSEDRSIRFWSLETPQLVRTVCASATGPSHSVSWTADCQAIAATGGGRVWLWDTASGQAQVQEGPDGFWRQARFCPTRGLLAFVNVFNSYASVVIQEVGSDQPTTGFVTGVTELFPQSPRSLTWSPDGQWLAVGGFSSSLEDRREHRIESRVEVWNVDSGEQIFTTPPLCHQFDCAAWAPDNKRLALSYRNYNTQCGYLAIYDTTTGSLIREMSYRGESIPAICWTPDGRWLAIGTSAGRIHVWDVDQAVKLQTIQAHSVSVTALDWSPDSSCLVSSSEDGTARLWDASGEERLTLGGSGDSIADVQWSGNGRQLAAIDSSGRITIWDASRGYACAASDAYSQERAEILCEDADSLASGGQWEEVVEVVSRAIEMDPRSFLAWRRRATAHQRLGNLNEALADWSAVLGLESHYSHWWLARGALHRELGRMKEAVADFSQAIDINPEYRENWFERAVTYAALGRWDNASADFARLLEISVDYDPLYLRALYLQTLVHLQRGDLSEYRKTCQQVLERSADTTNKSFANSAAWTCAVGPQAVADFKPVVELARRAMTEGAPNAPNLAALVTLGAVFYRAGRFPEAARTFDDLLSHWNDDKPDRYSRASTGFFLAMVHHRLGHATDAKQWMAKATEQADTELAETSSAWNRRAVLQLLRNEAQELLQTSIQAKPETIDKAPGHEPPKIESKQPDQPPQDSAVTPPPKSTEPAAYLDQGHLYAILGRNEAALTALQKALTVPQANHAKIHLRRSEIYREMGQFDKAIAVCNEALRLEPDNAEVFNELGNCNLFKGDLDQAIIAYSKCIDLPEDARPGWLRSGAVRRRGEVYALLSQDEKARRDFEHALQMEPNGPWNCGGFAEFLALCADPSYRDPERAVQLARRGVELDPNIDWLWRALGAAQLRQGDLDAALASLQKAGELGRGAPFLLAIVHHRRGNTDQARKYFELGEQRLRNGYWDWGAPRRLRDEAAELLGITETPSGKPEEEKKPDQRSADDSGTTGQEASDAGEDSPPPGLP